MGREVDTSNPHNLVKIDFLPARSGLQVEIDRDDQDIRFRAFYILNGKEMFSLWTQKYPLTDCPVQLQWAALWPRGDPTTN